MTVQTAQTPATWDSVEGEMDMEDGHGPSWQALIDHIAEPELGDLDILDYGCNRGGFLRRLYLNKPFAHGHGVDIATDSLADAEARKGPAPLSFSHVDMLPEYESRFHIAFSHEVLYLLPDLDDHARTIHKALKPGGVYYAAIGEYAENPLWPRWKDIVAEFSPVPPQTYSLQDMALAFQQAGFAVSVRRMVCDGFLPYDAHEGKYLHSPVELVDFLTRHMMLFRLEKMI